MLQAEFPNLPVNEIHRKILEEGTGYAAYVALAEDEWAYEHAGKSPYPRLKHSRKVRPNLPDRLTSDSPGYNETELQRELQAARERITKIRGES